MSPKASVLVPVFNTEPWLERCLDSALGQTLEDIEIVCVDDASTDGSLSILRSFEARYKRVRVISFSDHEGVSAARNAALDIASGEYVYFLDSDDWIDPDYLETMLDKALRNDCDVIVNSNFIKEYSDQSRNELSGDFGFISSDEGFYPSAVVQSRMLSALCFRMFNKGFLDKNNIRFPLIQGGGEDAYFTGLSEVLNPEVFVFKGPYYHYFQRDSSVAHSRDRAFPYIQNYKALRDALRDRGIPLDGLRLFYAGALVIDSSEKYDFIRSYLLEIEPQMRSYSWLYTVHDLLLLDVVSECPDYKTFLSRHNPIISVEFIRRMIKNHSR